MKIAYLSCVMPPYPGGIGVAAQGMAKEMARRGHEARTFSPFHPFRPLVRFGNAAFLPQLLWRLRGFNIIHLLYPFYGVAELVPLLKRTTRAKIVVHHMMDAVAPGFKGRVFAWHSRHLMPSIFRAADRVLVLSKDYARNSAVANLGVKWEVVPHGIDTDLFKPATRHPERSEGSHTIQHGDEILQSPRGSFRITEGLPMILFVGGLDRAHYFKGVPVLIEACRILKARGVKFQCQIVGDGEMRKEYEEQAEVSGILIEHNPPPPSLTLREGDRSIPPLRVRGGEEGLRDTYAEFLGLVPHDQLPAYYQRSTVCVVPSTEPIECFSIVAAEAQACSIPVIVTDFPGVRVTIEHAKTGFVVPPANAEALAERIQWILENPDEARAMGAAGRARVEQMYSWKVVGDRLEKVYASLYNS